MDRLLCDVIGDTDDGQFEYKAFIGEGLDGEVEREEAANGESSLGYGSDVLDFWPGRDLVN